MKKDREDEEGKILTTYSKISCQRFRATPLSIRSRKTLLDILVLDMQKKHEIEAIELDQGISGV